MIGLSPHSRNAVVMKIANARFVIMTFVSFSLSGGLAMGASKSTQYEILKPVKADIAPVPSADRNAPADVKPVEHAGVRYEAPTAERGVLIAYDVKSGAKSKKPKELWRAQVVNYALDSKLETDVQETWISKLELPKGSDELIITDERGLQYVADLKKKKISILKWPVTTKIVEARPFDKGWKYSVELRITNTLNRPLAFDAPSVASDGSLHNDLFRVTVDGAKVGYRGPLARRAPPDPKSFIQVGPGETYRVDVELTSMYPVPPGRHDVTVAFEHTNHFSPDSFKMVTEKPDARQFSGDGGNFR